MPPPSLPLPAIEVPVVHVDDININHASVLAAEMFLRTRDIPLKDDLPIALLDVSVLKRQADLWRTLLPRVEPFYAVKCNPNPAVIEALWSIWTEYGSGGFDCASPAEMQLVLPLGVDPAKHIVYANPCKQVSAVTFAREAGVKRYIFDNTAELDKLAAICPAAELVLRVQTDDALAQCPLSNKFGAAPADCEQLLARAKELEMEVVGVSFHVGSGCSQEGAFRGALHRARAAFDEAKKHGFNLKLLDIGGGFPGWDEDGLASFSDHASDIRELLEELFPSPDIQVIAEPGRFFVATAQAMLTTVVSVAESPKGDRYYLNDGLYGSFNCVLYDHASVPKPKILRRGHVLQDEELSKAPVRPCTVFGPTCDGFDVITDSMPLPKLEAQDRLLFPGMGAYTSAASTSFNGFAPADVFVYQSQLSSGIQ
jgi:ornithine decarboxylase